MLGLAFPELSANPLRSKGVAIATLLRKKQQVPRDHEEGLEIEENRLGWVASTALSLAKQVPGILGIIAVVWINSNIMQSQSSMAEQILKIQTVELKSVIEKNTEAFMKVHEHFEAMARLLEHQKT